jgi:integrase
MSVLVYCNPRRVEQVNLLENGVKEILGDEVLLNVPALLDQNNKFVPVVNAWFYHLKATEGNEDLSSYAKGLLRYWRFLESKGLAWNELNQPKSMKPTYLFRSKDLLPAVKAETLARSTANLYIGHMVNFYIWAIENDHLAITKQSKPFDVHFVERRNNSKLGHMMPSFTVQTHDLKIKQVGKSKGAELCPLNIDEITLLSEMLKQESIEFRLIVLLSIMSGFRIGESTSFTIGALNGVMKNDGANYETRIGPFNGVGTKYGKERDVELPASLCRSLEKYQLSERRTKRLMKTDWVNEVSDKEPLFITQHGNAYDRDSMETLWSEFKRKLRRFDTTFKHRHHNLRSTYGTYRLDSLLKAGMDAGDAMSLVMDWMGHENEATTWKYLQYLNKKTMLREKISMLDGIMHDCLGEGV